MVHPTEQILGPGHGKHYSANSRLSSADLPLSTPYLSSTPTSRTMVHPTQQFLDPYHGTPYYFLPIVFHNLKSYDAHFVIKKQYTEQNKPKKRATVGDEDRDDERYTKTTTYGDVIVTPLNGEKYLSFQVGNLRFLDSFQFLSTSLETSYRCC